MMSKTLIVASVLAVALSACNKKDETAPPASNPAPATSAPAPRARRPPVRRHPTPRGGGSTTPSGSTTPAS